MHVNIRNVIFILCGIFKFYYDKKDNQRYISGTMHIVCVLCIQKRVNKFIAI